MDNILLRVARILNETAESKTFFFSSLQENLSYKAGQFLTFLLNINGKEIRRSYSFGSTPGVDDEMFVTIKRIENGAISRHFFDHVKIGDQLTSLPPSGRFVIEDPTEFLYVFIAAGSGIIPIFSLLKQVLFQRKNNVLLVYQNTSEDSSIYRSQLLRLKEYFPERFTLTEVFSKPTMQSSPQRLNNHLLEQIVRVSMADNKPMFYLCGPLEFMRMVNFTLRVMGYKEEQIKKENFVIEFVPKAPFMSDVSPKNVTVHFNDETYQLVVAYPHNILEVALKHNIQLPYSCRGGRCGTCTASCIVGKVKMSINDILTEKDIENGLILTCVAYPETDVEIRFEV